MKTITVLSGKGGVGKSSISASLALAMSKTQKILCADCDVDASNLSLVFGAEKYKEWEGLSTNKKAVFDYEKCDSCKKCFDSCYFNAIGWKEDKPYLKEFSCEGCSVCEIVCPYGAITMKSLENAKIGYANTKYGFKVVSAQLNPGESGSGKVVSSVRQKAREIGADADIILVDSAAGIGCPVIASVTGTDYAVIVTEPTPAGFSDMKKAIELLDHFKIPRGLIINKYNLNEALSSRIERFAKERNMKILGKLPFDKQFAKALVNMVPIMKFDSNYENFFSLLAHTVLLEVQSEGFAKK